MGNSLSARQKGALGLLALLVATRPRLAQFLGKSLIFWTWFLVSCCYGVGRGVLLPGDRKNLNAKGSSFFAHVTPLLGIRHRVVGRENLDAQPCVYAMNHQSTLDVLSAGHVVPGNTGVIAKKELAYVPLFGWFLSMGPNVFVDRENPENAVKSMERAGRELSENKSAILVFPEGTRSRSDGELLPFKMGTFNLAVGGQVPIVPIVVSNQKPVYDSKNWAFPGGDIVVKVLPAIPTKGLTRENVPELADRVRQLMVKELQKSKL